MEDKVIMKRYMKEHLHSLRRVLEFADEKQDWATCLAVDAKIDEAEHLYTEMLRRNLLSD